jgi:hypothetical protein
MFDANKLATSAIQRVRLKVGDVLEYQLLEDSVYQYLLLTNDNDELDTAIEAVETIITYLVMNPTDESVGSVGQSTAKASDFEKILTRLKKEKEDSIVSKRIPMIVTTDRSNWDDINSIYGSENY